MTFLKSMCFLFFYIYTYSEKRILSVLSVTKSTDIILNRVSMFFFYRFLLMFIDFYRFLFFCLIIFIIFALNIDIK